LIYIKLKIKQLSDLEISDIRDIDEGIPSLIQQTVCLHLLVVQTELTKVALLKFRILESDLSSKDLAHTAVEPILHDLQEWYEKLPIDMHVGNLAREDISNSVKGSICHVHVLYLDAIISLHRLIAFQFFNVYNQNFEVSNPLRKLLVHADKGVLAAKHCARILSLLQSEGMMYKKCWLVL
jgi:hypothetical protein